MRISLQCKSARDSSLHEGSRDSQQISIQTYNRCPSFSTHPHIKRQHYCTVSLTVKRLETHTNHNWHVFLRAPEENDFNKSCFLLQK